MSIIEFRLMNLFDMIDTLEIPFFFPGLLFNETFWQCPFEKRLAILAQPTGEWLGADPIYKSCLFKDPFFLDLIKSIKLTYFSNTRVTIENLLEILKIKNNFALSEFAPFGDSNASPIKFLNTLARNHATSFTKPIDPSQIEMLAKLGAVKFYTRFNKNKSVDSFVHSIAGDENYWEHFFKSLQILDEKQGTTLTQKCSFYFTDSSQEVVETFQKNIQSRAVFEPLIENGQLQFEVLDIVDFEPNRELDYIFLNCSLSALPTDILTKFGNVFYQLDGRVVYTDRTDEKKAVEKISEFQAPIKGESKITSTDIKNLDFEIFYSKYTNEKALELIEERYGVVERSFVRFSIPIFRFFVNAIHSLRPQGYIDVWDIAESAMTDGRVSLIRTEEGGVQTPVHYNLYTTILESFEDIHVKVNRQNYEEVLAGSSDKKGRTVITLENLITSLIQHENIYESFFNEHTVKHWDSVQKAQKGLKKYKTLKAKRIMLFGISSALYNSGFNKFKKSLLADSNFAHLIEREKFINKHLGSYDLEFVQIIASNMIDSAVSQRTLFISKDKDSKSNKEFFEFLEKYGLDPAKIMEVINENWELISSDLLNSVSYELLEIIKLSEQA